MALKSKEWFYKICLQEVKKHGRFSHLAWDILEKGVGQKDSTRGHVTQAIGVAQEFLKDNPRFKSRIRRADPTRPFDVSADPKMQATLKNWLAKKPSKTFGKKTFGYSFKTFKNVMTPTVGGRRTGGGGGNDEFKRVLRLMAEFENRK